MADSRRTTVTLTKVVGDAAPLTCLAPAAGSTMRHPHCRRVSSVDVGHGWLIFGLPPSEMAVHPSDRNDLHEFYLMCDDVEAFVLEMARHGATCEAVQDQGWGRLTRVALPGGGKLGVYQPRHARPASTIGKP